MHARGDIHPITLSVIWKNLVSTAEEMGAVLRRTAFSPALREAKDFSASIHDAEGRLVAHGHFTPGHTGAAMGGVPQMLESVDSGALEAGDGLLTNDLALTVGHLPDMFSVVPVHVDGEILGYSVTTAHHVDVGGPSPGSLSIDGVRDVYAEGLRVTPIKYYVRGEPNRDVFQLIRANVRLPDRVEGDLHAQMNANRRGVKRLQEIAARHSVHGVRTAMREILNRSESGMRRAISELPDGRYEFEDRMDDYGPDTEPLVIRVAIEVVGTELEVDFSGSSPQVEAGINCYLGFTVAYTLFALKAVLDPHGRSNAGSLRPITIKAPAGCFLNPRHPAPGGGRAVVLTRVVDVVIGALAEAVPDRVVAAPSQFMNSAFGGHPENGDPFVYFELLFGGTGARPNADGEEAMCSALDVNNIPIEVYEATSPMIVERLAIVPDSAGAGRFRGGCALRKDIRVLSDRVFLTNMGDRTTTPPYGLAGGRPGRVSRSLLVAASGDQPVSLESKASYALGKGDLVSLRLAGGGGFGDPLGRDAAAVARDVREGYVTASGAKRDYGVVIGPDGSVDLKATDDTRLAARSEHTAGQQMERES